MGELLTVLDAVSDFRVSVKLTPEMTLELCDPEILSSPCEQMETDASCGAQLGVGPLQETHAAVLQPRCQSDNLLFRLGGNEISKKGDLPSYTL